MFLRQIFETEFSEVHSFWGSLESKNQVLVVGLNDDLKTNFLRLSQLSQTTTLEISLLISRVVHKPRGRFAFYPLSMMNQREIVASA